MAIFGVELKWNEEEHGDPSSQVQSEASYEGDRNPRRSYMAGIPSTHPGNRLIRAALFAACLLFVGSGTSWAGLVTADQKNLNTFAEAMITSEIQISERLGFEADQILNFGGSFSDTGWLATLTGTYLGTSVNVTFIGSFDMAMNTGMFTSTGMLGSTSWTGTGAIAYTDVTPNDYSIDWVSNVFLAGEEFDVEVKKVYNYKEEDDTVTYTDTGTIQKTKDGKPVGKPMKEDPSKGKFPKPSDKGAGEYLIRVENLYALDSQFDTGTGTISGQVSTVPEPSTWLMFGTGLLGLRGYGWLRRRRVT